MHVRQSYIVSLCTCFGTKALHKINDLGLCIRVHVFLYSFNTASYEPRHEKICIRGLRAGQPQNGLYSHNSYIAED